MSGQSAPQSTPRIGQVYEDTYLETARAPWIVKVMKLNAKSVRVEPCNAGGWYTVAGYDYQYRMELTHFENGRMRLVHDPEAGQ